MLNRKQLVMIISTILLSTSILNLFCSATPDTQATTSTQDALSQNSKASDGKKTNELIYSPGGGYEYLVYDNDGQLKSKFIKNVDDSSELLDYNTEGQLIQKRILNAHNETTSTIKYHLGKKVSETIYNADGTTKILYYKADGSLDPKDPIDHNRQRIIEIIKEIAPELHVKITKFDPDFSQHIIAGKGLAIRCVQPDGLPIIECNDEFKYESKESQKASIAHELGHYVLEHIIMKKSTYNQQSGERLIDQKSSAIKIDSTQLKSPVKGLEPNKAMTDAYVRTYEYEADAAIMKLFGLPLTDGQAMIKEMNDSTKGCTTFSIDHPKDEYRAQQLQSVDDELTRLGKKNADGTYKTEPINWDQAQYDVLKYYRSGLSLNKKQFVEDVKKYVPEMLSKAVSEDLTFDTASTVTSKKKYDADGKKKSNTTFLADGNVEIIKYDANEKEISKEIQDKDGKVISKSPTVEAVESPIELPEIDSPSKISMGQGEVNEENNENNKPVLNEIAGNKIIMGDVTKTHPASTLPPAEEPIKPTGQNHPPLGTELISHHQAAPVVPASHAITAE